MHLPCRKMIYNYFTPREIDEIGEKVASIYGKSKKEFNEVHAINPKILSIATELDRYAIKVMKEGNLL